MQIKVGYAYIDFLNVIYNVKTYDTIILSVNILSGR